MAAPIRLAPLVAFPDPETRSSAVIPIAPKDSNKNCICNSVSLVPMDLNFELRRILGFAAPVSEICAPFTTTRRLPFVVLSAAFFIDFSVDVMGRWGHRPAIRIFAPEAKRTVGHVNNKLLSLATKESCTLIAGQDAMVVQANAVHEDVLLLHAGLVVALG